MVAFIGPPRWFPLAHIVCPKIMRGMPADYRGLVTERPYVLLSCGMSIDGYLDDASGERLLLSNDADFDRVDEERAGCDAILVGASTIRSDNPRLLVRSAERRAARTARGEHPNPVKVTVTSSCHLDPQAAFFTTGESAKLIYCATPAVEEAQARFTPAQTGGTPGKSLVTVVDGGDPVDVRRVVNDLAERGIRRLMVEGGGRMHTQFLTAGLADELQLVIAPLFVGDSRAPRFVHDGVFPWGPHHRAGLAEVRQIGDVVLLRYALSERFTKA
jgi:5-amino-6-(5-phosphoribosylamino)uracil reductase